MIAKPARTSWLFSGTMSTPVYLWRIPDALIGKLEGLKPPRVALVSLHLGAFSFPESETMTIEKVTIGNATLYLGDCREVLPTLPVYAIDAPTAATSAPASSMPTASLTVLLGEHDIGVSAVTANKMLARAGMLEEMTRPSSKGTVKKFWSVTEAGHKYGKNVTSPSNPKETQPHWYRDTFRDLVRLHLVA